MGGNVRKRTFGHVRPAKIQISLCKTWTGTLATGNVASDQGLLKLQEVKD